MIRSHSPQLTVQFDLNFAQRSDIGRRRPCTRELLVLVAMMQRWCDGKAGLVDVHLTLIEAQALVS